MCSVALFLGVFVCLSSGLNNGLSRTPAQGYNTWNDYRCDRINEANVLRVMDAFLRLDLPSVGYNYVNLDDCWAEKRLSNGTIVANAQRFPHGIAWLADQAHKRGLKLGIYTDRGTRTCQGLPGSKGFEKNDASTYASWGIDYLKEDSCFASDDHNVAFAEYATMRDALNATGRPILFSLCGWNSWYAPRGASLGNSWRIAGDVNSWEDALRAMDTNAQLAQYAGPGGFNDPDMLLGSSAGSSVRLTPDQSRTQFSVWSVMAAPLLLGANVANMSKGDWDYVTFTNPEVIKVDQDPLGQQGQRISGKDMHGTFGDATNVWARKLSDGSWAAVFVNNHLRTSDVTCDSTCFSKMFPSVDQAVSVRDLWKHAVVGTTKNSWTAKGISGNGGSAMFRFIPISSTTKPKIQ